MKNLISFLLFSLLIAGCSGEKSTFSIPDPPPASDTESTEKLPKLHEILPASQSFYQQAVLAYGKGNHTDALQLANRALEQDKENYQALSLKGIILAFDMSPEEGIPYIEKSLTIAPGYTQAFYDMAMAQKLGGHPDISNAYFEKVVHSDSQNVWSYYGMATNWADMGNKDRSLLYLEKAVVLGGADVIAAAERQNHFSRFRDDTDFQKILDKK